MDRATARRAQKAAESRFAESVRFTRQAEQSYKPEQRTERRAVNQAAEAAAEEILGAALAELCEHGLLPAAAILAEGIAGCDPDNSSATSANGAAVSALIEAAVIVREAEGSG